jgi:hypothetical protein
MKTNNSLWFFAAFSFVAFSCGNAPQKEAMVESEEVVEEHLVIISDDGADNTLTQEEADNGWTLLFDGQSMDLWRVFNTDTLFGWEVKGGEMVALGTAGLEGLGSDIVSKEEFTNFELSLEWKVSTAGNSGVFFNVVEGEDLHAVYESGPEYQLIDDIGFPMKLEDWQKSGANYAMHAPTKVNSNPAGEWNHTKITVNNGKVTHELNGMVVVTYELWTPEWEALKQEGKWKEVPTYGQARSGHLALQDHGNQSWFKNIKVRRLD